MQRGWTRSSLAIVTAVCLFGACAQLGCAEIENRDWKIPNPFSWVRGWTLEDVTGTGDSPKTDQPQRDVPGAKAEPNSGFSRERGPEEPLLKPDVLVATICVNVAFLCLALCFACVSVWFHVLLTRELGNLVLFVVDWYGVGLQAVYTVDKEE